MQIPGFLSEENKLSFSFLKFFDENNIAKLAVDMWRNCSNRLCQSTFSVFNTFSNFFIALIY